MAWVPWRHGPGLCLHGTCGAQHTRLDDQASPPGGQSRSILRAPLLTFRPRKRTPPEQESTRHLSPRLAWGLYIPKLLLPAARVHVQPQDSPLAVALAAGGDRGGPGHGVTGEALLSRAGLAAHSRPPPYYVLTASPPFAVGALEAACCLTGDLHEAPHISSCEASSGWSADVHLGAILHPSPPGSRPSPSSTLAHLGPNLA